MGLPGASVRCCILRSPIGLCLDDSPDQPLPINDTNYLFPNEGTRDRRGLACIKTPLEWVARGFDFCHLVGYLLVIN